MESKKKQYFWLHFTSKSMNNCAKDQHHMLQINFLCENTLQSRWTTVSNLFHFGWNSSLSKSLPGTHPLLHVNSYYRLNFLLIGRETRNDNVNPYMNKWKPFITHLKCLIIEILQLFWKPKLVIDGTRKVTTGYILWYNS